MRPRPITLLSDYGTDDEFAGVCRAVIARIAPDAPVIDLTHGVRRHAVAEGAAVLARALPYAPPGVHVAVVDPGVGSTRGAVAIRVSADERVLVGPDNGLLAPAAERLGGAVEAADISRSPHRLEPVSATFHGRDLFAPVAAHLSLSVSLDEVGTPVDPTALSPSPLPRPKLEGDRALAHVVLVDRYGNAALDVESGDIEATGLTVGHAVEVTVGGEGRRADFVRTFSDAEPGGLILYEDSYRSLALAVNRGSAAAELGLRAGSEVVLSAA